MALMTNVQGNDTIFNAAAVIVAEGIGILCWLDALFLLSSIIASSGSPNSPRLTMNSFSPVQSNTVDTEGNRRNKMKLLTMF